MSLRYQTGELVMTGDRVLLDGRAGVIEFLVDPTVDDPSKRWWIENHGKGVLVSQLQDLGSLYTDPEEDPDLHFVGRGPGMPEAPP
jgi:hypothetical protein